MFDEHDLVHLADVHGDGDDDEEGFFAQVTEITTQPGMMNQFMGMAQSHFPKRVMKDTGTHTLAAILMPSMEKPDTCTIWEEFESQGMHRVYLEGGEQKKFFDSVGMCFVAPPVQRAGWADHYQRKDVQGEKYGIIAHFTVQPGKMGEFQDFYEGHFTRQMDGREPNATVANAMRPQGDPSLCFFFEQWETRADYQMHSAPNPNLKTFFDGAPKFIAGTPNIKEGRMMYWQQKDLKTLEENRDAICCCTIL